MVTKNKDSSFRNPNSVQVLFFALVILGGIITFLTNNPADSKNPLNDNMAIKIAYTTIGLILVGLAFAVLNKGSTIHTDDRIKRIEKKLDKILERRDDVIQNKFNSDDVS